MTHISKVLPHVVHVTAPARFGGLESVVEALTSGLAGMGIRNTIVCVLEKEEPDHPFVGALRAGGSVVVPVVVRARAYMRELRLLERLIGELDADIVHTHGYRSDVIGGLAARRAGRATVCTLHGFTARSRTAKVLEWVQRRSLRRCDAVIAVSPGIVNRVRASGVSPDRIHLIPNAWGGGPPLLERAAAREELGLPADDFVVGWIGRLSHEKGADVFLEALARWNRTGVVASIVGDGRERETLVRQAGILGVDKFVRWHGVRPEAGRLMRAFDALVLSSRTEGVPMVVLEAMHARTPLIATAVGGIPSVVDASQAILVPSESPVALADALERLRADPEASRERAERAALHLAGAFAMRPWLERHVEIYERVRNRGGTARR